MEVMWRADGRGGVEECKEMVYKGQGIRKRWCDVDSDLMYERDEEEMVD